MKDYQRINTMEDGPAYNGISLVMTIPKPTKIIHYQEEGRTRIDFVDGYLQYNRKTSEIDLYQNPTSGKRHSLIRGLRICANNQLIIFLEI